MRPKDQTGDEAVTAAAMLPASQAPIARPRRKVRTVWLKQLHTWHWISAAVSLVGMLLFSITGITLNHADLIPATPKVVARSARLSPSLLEMLRPTPKSADSPVPGLVADAVAKGVGLDPSGKAAEWSDDEVYIAMPRAGGDAWVSIDRTSGGIKSETTNQGFVALLNDLHKGRNTGLAWRIFIDVFAAAAILFTLTGLLLLQLHARHRKLTWPVIGLGLAIPAILFLIFIH